MFSGQESYYSTRASEAAAAQAKAAQDARTAALITTPLPAGTGTSPSPPGAAGTTPVTSSNRASSVLTGQGQGLLDNNNSARRVLLGS